MKEPQYSDRPWDDEVAYTTKEDLLNALDLQKPIRCIMNIDGDICYIAHTFDSDIKESIESRANAKLITAAPDLLEALQEARSFMNSVAITDPNGDPFAEDDEENEGLNELKALADAAIDKATTL